LLVVASLAAWSAALLTTARRLELPARLLIAEVGLAVVVSFTMLVMTAATAVWWGVLASRAPWALHEQPMGSDASPMAPQLLVAMALMAVATLLAWAGAIRALLALPRLHTSDPRSA
jgi:hypothetical protein